MKPFRRLLIVFAVSISAFLPQHLSWACGPMPVLPEDFRLSLFDAAIYDKNAAFSPYYFSLNTYYKDYNPMYAAALIENDENYSEWQRQLRKTPFSKRDFYDAVNKFTYQIITDSSNELRKSNTFFNALMKRRNQAYLDYFKLAKSTEEFNGNGTSNLWGTNSNTDVPDSVIYHVTQEMTGTKNRFIRQRAAYLLCRLFFYNNDSKNLQSVYHKYLDRKDVHSWVKPAAKYYSITALYNTDTSFSKEYCRALIDVIDMSDDKRLPCIRQLEEKSKEKVLSLLSTKHERATAIAAYSMRNPGYGLAAMKQVYALDPNSKFLPLLLNREINKLEDWLLTPSLTEFKLPGSRSDYNWARFEDSALQKGKQNLVKDKRYANQVAAFAQTMNRNHRYDASLCHLFFLQKNWAAAERYCNKILSESGSHSALRLQARVDHVIIRLQKEKAVSPSLQSEMYTLLTDLDNKDKKDREPGSRDKDDYFYEAYNNGYTLRDDLLVYLGRTALSLHDVVNASLLLSGTFKPWGEYTIGGNKNAYFLLYDYGKESDFKKLLSILRKKKRTPYENYFISRKADLEGNYAFYNPYIEYYGTHITRFWDVNKVLDIEGTHFIKEDNLPKALAAFRQVPDTFWTSSVYLYKDYLTGNPFILNLYNTHECYRDNKETRLFNPNKTQFVQKLLLLKNKAQLSKDKEEKARLYYAIGNAYYSMSFRGKFWLMSKLWREEDERHSLKAKDLTTFDYDYYTAARAKPYYLKAMTLTGDAERAAFYFMYLTRCENEKQDLIAFFLYQKQHPDAWYDGFGKQKNPYFYTRLLKQHKGSDGYYERIITECPVYTDFRNGIEKGL